MSKYIKRLISEEIDRRAADIPKVSPPQGYNPLEVIRGGMYHWCYVPVNAHIGGTHVWMQLRTSNASQLDACGGVSLIEDIKNVKEATKEQVIEMRNKMESICKITMNNPTFDEFVSMVTDSDFVHSKARIEIERLKNIDTTGLSAKEIDFIDQEIYKHEMHLAFLLPEDTFDFIVRWANGVDVSDIKKLTREQLLEAAILASNGHDSPHNHLSGVFTDRDMGDIDKSAWAIYNEYMEMKRVEKRIK